MRSYSSLSAEVVIVLLGCRTCPPPRARFVLLLTLNDLGHEKDTNPATPTCLQYPAANYNQPMSMTPHRCSLANVAPPITHQRRLSGDALPTMPSRGCQRLKYNATLLGHADDDMLMTYLR